MNRGERGRGSGCCTSRGARLKRSAGARHCEHASVTRSKADRSRQRWVSEGRRKWASQQVK